ncbi:hypothetical protein GQF42_00400 [Streptomyces broussonetiae]|uniref:Uncharacterized protein n=1 Tax=Streptomyces broussonetiae TaxID=2686304 RepID=A0A6I6MZW7_9ACTN|nr:hypothetical protein [Streptomyces broussonetiae]QHA02035.1 hypothetical protein GQF42_00400 [Streptomyces broussonetiae]
MRAAAISGVPDMMLNNRPRSRLYGRPLRCTVRGKQLRALTAAQFVGGAGLERGQCMVVERGEQAGLSGGRREGQGCNLRASHPSVGRECVHRGRQEHRRLPGGRLRLPVALRQVPPDQLSGGRQAALPRRTWQARARQGATAPHTAQTRSP